MEQLTLVQAVNGRLESVHLPEPTRRELVRVMAELILAIVARSGHDAPPPGTDEEVRGDE